jgi:hypothetical protein
MGAAVATEAGGWVKRRRGEPVKQEAGKRSAVLLLHRVTASLPHVV